MRIHSLTMTGIGPYAGREHIDFDAVGASGRFLLTGPTGSGKTTIIDAIVFALYGDVADSADSSKERIRSTLVGPHTESVIELVFSTGAGVYRVRRTPTYERAKRRGQGTTTQNGTVKLWHLAEVGGEPLDEPVTRVGDADAEIARAVGLSREQFTQTVVLPQGKFARFLRADSSERQHLLKDVFGTGIYDAIQDALIQASRDGARRVEQAAADLRGQVASLGHTPSSPRPPPPLRPQVPVRRPPTPIRRFARRTRHRITRHRRPRPGGPRRRCRYSWMTPAARSLRRPTPALLQHRPRRWRRRWRAPPRT